MAVRRKIFSNALRPLENPEQCPCRESHTDYGHCHIADIDERGSQAYRFEIYNRNERQWYVMVLGRADRWTTPADLLRLFATAQEG